MMIDSLVAVVSFRIVALECALGKLRHRWVAQMWHDLREQAVHGERVTAWCSWAGQTASLW
jgi:hypothetical protein